MNLTFALEIIGTIFRKKAGSVGYALFLALVLSSCLSTRYLQGNQKLLYRQTIEAPKGFNKSNLQGLYIQKSAPKILGVPISFLNWMYHKGEVNFDKQQFIDKKDKVDKKFNTKITKASSARKKDNLEFRKKKKLDGLDTKIENGNLFMQWGEPIAVYDSSKLALTLEKMNNYLFINGYFKGSIDASVAQEKKRVNIVYHATPRNPYLIDTILYQIPDPHVLELIKRNETKVNIGKGMQYNQDKITKERERIDLYLKDLGYYDFTRQYIDFQIDTSSKKQHRIILQMEIRNPDQATHHKQFKIDSINVTTDVGIKPTTTGLKRVTDPYRDITFNYYHREYRNKLLATRVFLKKDSLYSRTQTFNTQRQMANLDVFKFININYDTSGGRFIANIFASPLEQYSWTNEAGATVSQGFPGPYISTSIKKRNLFGGLEIFELSGRYGYEGVASATETGNFYQSTEANVTGAVTFPQFLFPLSNAALFRYAKYNPRTRLSGSYTYTDRPEYQRGITNFSATFSWDLSQKLKFSFTPTSLNMIRSTLDSTFQASLIKLQQDQGNNLINAFKPSFVGSMIFSVTRNNNYGNTQKHSSLIRATFESGGTFLNFYTPQVIINQGLEPYQFIRLSVDYRKNIFINKTTSVAYRINTGFGYAYSPNKILPYEKNFFAGGSNSIRAWRPRRLGLGSDPPPLSTNPSKNGYFDYKYEKPGEILLEASIEWRQKIFGFLNYALFVDAGNVWNLRNSNVSSIEGTKFYLDTFYKQFGVGTGLGLRFDFSFLILRLDMGIKVYDPARTEGDRFILRNVSFTGPYGINNEPVIYNIGIGYPF
jgi:outer membrane protein assembly factor BamA